jgi:hypothetical protein
MTTPRVRLDTLEQFLHKLATRIRNRHRNVLRELWIKLQRGGVVVRGLATSYYGKQIAFHECVRRCPLPVLANKVEVIPVEKKETVRPSWD